MLADRLILASTLVTLIGCAVANYDVKQTQLGLNNQIEVGPSNYAIVGSEVSKLGYSSVAVNGDDVVTFTDKCVTQTRKFKDLPQDHQSAINSAKNTMSSVHQFIVYSSSGGLSANGMSLIFHGNEKIGFGDGCYTFGRDNMGDVQRLFMFREVAVFVYKSGRVESKPAICASDVERIVLLSNNIDTRKQELNSIGDSKPGQEQLETGNLKLEQQRKQQLLREQQQQQYQTKQQKLIREQQKKLREQQQLQREQEHQQLQLKLEYQQRIREQEQAAREQQQRIMQQQQNQAQYYYPAYYPKGQLIQNYNYSHYYH